MNVVGLDLSITATGIAAADGRTSTVTIKLAGDLRLTVIRDEVARAVQGADLVVIEDLPTHAKAAGITGLVHGAVRAYLIDDGIPYALVAPASLKKYATGRGNAGKPEMAVAAFKRLGLEAADDNQIDAAWLRAAGLDHLNQAPAILPAAQRAALHVMKWPTIKETAAGYIAPRPGSSRRAQEQVSGQRQAEQQRPIDLVDDAPQPDLWRGIGERLGRQGAP